MRFLIISPQAQQHAIAATGSVGWVEASLAGFATFPATADLFRSNLNSIHPTALFGEVESEESRVESGESSRFDTTPPDRMRS